MSEGRQMSGGDREARSKVRRFSSAFGRIEEFDNMWPFYTVRLA